MKEGARNKRGMKSGDTVGRRKNQKRKTNETVDPEMPVLVKADMIGFGSPEVEAPPLVLEERKISKETDQEVPTVIRPMMKEGETLSCEQSGRKKAIAKKGAGKKLKIVQSETRSEELRGRKRNHDSVVISPLSKPERNCSVSVMTGKPVIKGKLTDALSAIKRNYDSDDEDDEGRVVRSSLFISDSQLEELGDILLELDPNDPNLYWPTEDITEPKVISDIFSFKVLDESLQKSDDLEHIQDLPEDISSEVPTKQGTESRTASPTCMPPPQLRPPNGKKRRTKLKAETSEKGYEPDELQQAALASIGVHKDPSMLSTRELATNIHALSAGMHFCKQLIKREINVNQLSKKLKLPGSVKNESDLFLSPARPPSPDITDLCPMKKKEEDDDVLKPEKKKDKEEDDYADHDAALPILSELIRRRKDLETREQEYEPRGDEFDLSQGSMCMVSLFDRYPAKSRRFKKYKKRIRNLDEVGIARNFQKILRTLIRVTKGEVESERMDLWNSRHKAGGYEIMGRLRQLHAISPFTETQGHQIITLLEKHFVHSNACDGIEMGNFLTYVMLPEAAIRIYAIVNRRSYNQAELEMQNGATAIND